jgi:predicted transcriptional regulator of viral defense system
MEFEQFRNQVKVDIFDYQLLTSYLRDFKKIRDKISSLLSEGKIVRIKKGLYVFGELWRKNPLSLELVANLLYGPSCISFEYALSYYGLIAERPISVTSLTIGDSKTFDTPLGIFTYRAIDREKFKIGVEYKDLGDEGGFFIASKEKALVDLIYRTPGIRTLEQLRHYLFEELRIEETLFRELDSKSLLEIAKIYNKNSTKMIQFL